MFKFLVNEHTKTALKLLLVAIAGALVEAVSGIIDSLGTGVVP